MTARPNPAIPPEAPPARTIQSDLLSATVWPEQGGVIASLRDHTGHEWLAQPAGPRAATATPRPVFTDDRMSGWDECAPTISACRTAGGDELPEHGDLWDVPWNWDGDWLVGTGRSLDYTLRRRITPTSTGLRLHYEVHAGRSPIPFYWSAHPQLQVGVDGVVELPAVTEVVDALSPGQPHVAWSGDLGRIDTVPVGGSRKFILRRDAGAAWAAVATGGRRLTLSWDPALLPCLAVWFDHGRFSREPVIAPEPATGWFDSLATAEGNGTAWRLQPGEVRAWWVDLSVD